MNKKWIIKKKKKPCLASLETCSCSWSSIAFSRGTKDAMFVICFVLFCLFWISVIYSFDFDFDFDSPLDFEPQSRI